MTALAYAVMDGDVLLRKTGSSAGHAPAIYATRAHVEAEAGKHPSTVGWCVDQPPRREAQVIE